jgi:hypothetical protein
MHAPSQWQTGAASAQCLKISASTCCLGVVGIIEIGLGFDTGSKGGKQGASLRLIGLLLVRHVGLWATSDTHAELRPRLSLSIHA